MVSVKNWMLLIRPLWANSMTVLSLSISNHVTDVCKWRYTMRRGLSSFRGCLCACYSVQRFTLDCCSSKSVNHINYKTVQRTNRNKNGGCQLSLPKRNSLFGEWMEFASASTEWMEVASASTEWLEVASASTDRIQTAVSISQQRCASYCI